MKIQGLFDNLKQANKAIDALRDAGYKTASLDLKDQTMQDANMITNLPGTEMSTSLSDLVLESGNRGIDIEKASLSAADPMVSGMAGFEEIADYSYKIVVDANAKDATNVKDLIVNMGGELNEP